MKKAQTVIVAGSVLGLLVAAGGMLFIALWIHAHPQQGSSLNPSIFNPYQNQTEALHTYMSQALALHEQYKSGALTREQVKTAALKLTVPAVMRQRHLEWILNLDAGRDQPIEDMMQEYRLVQIAK